MFWSIGWTKLVCMDLATIEEIRQVKYRYLRCVDLKLWDELAEVFTPDATKKGKSRWYAQASVSDARIEPAR